MKSQSQSKKGKWHSNTWGAEPMVLGNFEIDEGVVKNKHGTFIEINSVRAFLQFLLCSNL